MQSSNIFLGREAELTKLMDVWAQVELGNPQWIALVAETGVGKTRLVQEFYRRLVAAENTSRTNAVGYWPDELPIDRDKLGLNPAIDGFSEGAKSIADIPWLWWGLRGPRDVRNAAGSGCAARDAKADLELHCAAIISKQAKENAARRVGIEAVKVVSNALGFGAIETFFGLFDSGSVTYEAVKALCANDEIVIRGEKSKQGKKLQDQLAEMIAVFLGQQIPVILVLDDAHWLDADTVAFVSRLIQEQAPKKMKLMILSTSWASEWHAAPIRGVYESFSECKSVISLDVVDQESAKKFLLSKFPGLHKQDVEFVWDRSEGNFRYLEEISIELSDDPWTYFVDEDRSKNLSSMGIDGIKSKKLDIEDLILKRFLKMERPCQVALMQSSYQGRRFDPQLTARVGQIVLGPAKGDPEKTLEALKLAANPGAMITEVELCLREFLQGPYYRLIREKFDRDEDKLPSARVAYQRLSNDGEIKVPDSIMEVLLEQWVEEVGSGADSIPLLARLLEIAFKGNRYQAGLRWLKQLASTFANTPDRPDLNPATSFAALRIFGQYAFGAGDQADRQLLEKFCINSAAIHLQMPIFERLSNPKRPVGCELIQLIEWCEALANLSEVLGHVRGHLSWLGNVCQLKGWKLESGATESSDRLSYAASLLHYAEKQVPMAGTRSEWDKLVQDFRTAEITIELLEGTEKSIFQGWHQICVLYLGRERRPHYPEVQDWGDDYQTYCYAAGKLGDVLCEIELAGGSDAHNGLLGLSDDLLEALLHGSTLTVEYALGAGHEIAAEFLDRVVLVIDLVSVAIFKRINEGGYVPTSLGFQAMESNLTVASMLDYLASAASQAVNPTRPAISGVQMYMLESRGIDASEAVLMMTQITAAVARYRELGMLSMGMIVIAARAGYDRLILTKAGTTEVVKVFECIMEDAVHTKDGERAAFGEPVQLLQWLVRIFDKWLSDAPGAEEIWAQLRGSYDPLEDERFNKLVEKIRFIYGVSPH